MSKNEVIVKKKIQRTYPSKPREPNLKKPERFIEKKEIFWSAKKGKVGLLDIIKKIPEEIKVDDISIQIIERNPKARYRYYRNIVKYVEICRIQKIEDPDYEEKLKKYNDSFLKYEKDKSEYKAKIASFRTYCRKMDALRKKKDLILSLSSSKLNKLMKHLVSKKKKASPIKSIKAKPLRK